MNFVKGKDRLVLVLPALGIVIKFPIIRAKEVFKKAFSDIRDKHWKAFARYFSTWSPESQYVASGKLLRGIVSNKRERRLWKRTRNAFLVPTFFSFFGLVNVEKYSKPYEGDYIDLWDQIRRITNEEAYLNPHQFSEVKNYSLVDGKLKMIDYGGHGSEWVIVKWGTRIMAQFDSQFRYAKSSGKD